MKLLAESRTARALRLLGGNQPPDATALADALWLAQFLTVPVRPKSPKAAKGARKEKRGKGKDPESGGAKPPAEPTTTPTPAPKPVERTGLYTPEKPKGDEPLLNATAVPVPAGQALPNRLLLDRALKPFLRKYASRRVRVLDEEATAEASAEHRKLTLRFRPAAERWFDVALLVEQDEAMEVWAETVRELQALLGRHGAFRRVRLWRYRLDKGALQLSTAQGAPVMPKVLADPEGRRLFLFVTNGTARAWREAALVEFVRTLGSDGVVAIVRTVPKRMWPHTALGDVTEWMRTAEPGAANAQLYAQDPFTEVWERAKDADCVPMVTLEEERVSTWARFVQSPRRVMHEAVRLRVAPLAERVSETHDPRELLLDFRAKASSQAFQLLRLLAGAPLTLPVMRLVQEALPGRREQVQLAEVMLSGLIEQVTPVTPPVPPDQVFYEFVPGVRELLVSTHAGRERLAIEESLEPAQERLRKYVEEQTGRTVRDFRALLLDPTGLDKLPESARMFLDVSRRVYERWGLAPATLVSAGRVAEGSLTLVGHTDVVRGVAWSPDGQHVASGSLDRSVRVWEASSGLQLNEWLVDHGVASVAWQPDGRHLAIGLRGGALQLWDLDGIALAKVVKVHRDTVRAVAWDRNGQRLASGSLDGTVREWLELRAIGVMRTAGAQVVSLAWSPDGKRVASGCHDGTFKLWPLKDWEPLTEKAGYTPVRGLAWHADGNSLIIGLEDGELQSWRVAWGNLPERVRSWKAGGAVASLAISPDGERLAVGFRTGGLVVWNIHPTELVQHFEGHRSTVWSVAWSPDGRRIATASADQTVKIWPVERVGSAKQTPRKSRKPRVLILNASDQRPELQDEVVTRLTAVGHRFATESEWAEADYMVVLVESAPTPRPMGALRQWLQEGRPAVQIQGRGDIEKALEELERDPLGPLRGVMPELARRIPRPQLELGLWEYFQSPVPRRVGVVYVQAPVAAGALVVMSWLCHLDEVRRAFPGGIYWDPAKWPEGRGAKLIVDVQGAFKAGTSGDVLVRFLRPKSRVETNAAVFKIGYLADRESAEFLRELSAEAQKGAQAFHANAPLLVAMTEEAVRAGVKLPVKGGIHEKFEAVAVALLEKMEPKVRAALARAAVAGALVRSAFDEENEADTKAWDAACRLGWVFTEPARPAIPLTRAAVQVLERRFADLCRRERERLVEEFESAPSRIDGETGAGLLALVPNAERMERFLSGPGVAEAYVMGGMREELVAALRPFRSGLLMRLRIELDVPDPSLERVAQILAVLGMGEGRWVVRCYVSCVRHDIELVRRLLTAIESLPDWNQEYDFEFRLSTGENEWASSQKDALRGVDMGLELLSMRYLDSEFHPERGFPPFIPQSNIVSVSLDGIRPEMEGFEDRDVFLDSKGRDFGACKTASARREFAAELFGRIRTRVLGKRQQTEAEVLLDELQDASATHERRWEIGQRLAVIGDPRPGVGVINGVPDFLWRAIPGNHKVSPFQMAAYEVTAAQFRAFLAAEDGYRDQRWWEGLDREPAEKSWEQVAANHPVTDISWIDATVFCRWVSARLGYEVRLPKEAEWEWAARSGQSANEYPWGTEWRDGVANTWESKLRKTTAVGMYPAGESGQQVADLAGNVWEWCHDDYSGGRESKVLRGGALVDGRDDARASYRHLNHPGVRNPNIGFRVVKGSVSMTEHSPPRVVRCFVSYDQADEASAMRLIASVETLFEAQTELKFQLAEHVDPGKVWRNEIESQLDECDLGLLLVSDRFVASEHTSGAFLPLLRKRAQLLPVALDRVPNHLILRGGLGDVQIFLDGEGRTFDACLTQKSRDEFARDLCVWIRRVLLGEHGPTEAEQLLAELRQASTTHERRWEIGQRLAAIGDPRPGVGVVDGAPDFLWRAIPGNEEVKPFHMAAYAVTAGQFRAFTAAMDGYWNDRWWEDLKRELEARAWEKIAMNHPVTHVSWYDATAFCRWVSHRLGYEVRLADEAERAWAARSAEPRYEYPWGVEWREGVANTRESKLEKTTAVGMYPAGESIQQVADLAGNVWEWCENLDSSEGESRVLRGGAWNYLLVNARAVHRFHNPPVNRNFNFGFRVVCSSPIR